ncbi:HK97-gp10 family putative phage morphogenesis protein [Beijerinckia mobilis]|uniref:HK97-gp10 family putative phage morphogenesis protein n=1 Tax=Beijerinckia mobilis TaxID=231434 RepID=UPI0005541F3A|nr:HK97-gp10 family putative phage morphogenesis protein [Beijerinckia mobilis]
MASKQLRDLTKRLEAIPKAVKNAVQPSLQKSGNELADMQKHLAPVDTGALRDSITVTPAGQMTPAYSQPGGSHIVPENAVAITVGNQEVRYPHLVEYGTAEAKAQPFFWPAFRLLKKRIENRTKRAISKAVKDDWNK